MDWYKKSTEQVLEGLHTYSDSGLTETEVQQRQGEYGFNELEDTGTKNIWQILFDQLKEIMVIILLVAALISFILGEYVDTGVILAIVVLDVILGFSQEYRAEKAMEALKKMAVPTVLVRRDGHTKEISSTGLVPGDIVLLETGNLVPADGRVIETNALKVDESALTGESDPVAKKVEALPDRDLVIGDQKNMVFSGTIVTYGRGVFHARRVEVAF